MTATSPQLLQVWIESRNFASVKLIIKNTLSAGRKMLNVECGVLNDCASAFQKSVPSQ